MAWGYFKVVVIIEVITTNREIENTAIFGRYEAYWPDTSEYKLHAAISFL